MQRSGLALAVLALLTEAPMHPYRMQQLIKQRGKDRVINVGQRSQLYKTIDRLQAESLITVAETQRSESGRERTIYTVTDEGRELAEQWTAAMLAAPRGEFPEFTAALAYLPLLTVEQAAEALEARLAVLHEQLRRQDRAIGEISGRVPRIVLIEEEYLRAHLVTDVEWIERIIGELRAGSFTWNRDELIALAEALHPAE